MDPMDPMLTALRASIIYFFVLLIVRLMGKREVGNIGAWHVANAWASYKPGGERAGHGEGQVRERR